MESRTMTSTPTPTPRLHQLKDSYNICFPIEQEPSYEPKAHAPAINSHRLWNTILSTSRYGLIPGTTGMNRLSLTQSDKDVRDWFVREATMTGCTIKVDAIGNIFAILPGSNMSLAPIGIGSHLDTQPAGGRFDGILGVIGALEVLKTIREAGVAHSAPIAAINWSNEEGARFESGCTGSAVWSGHFSLQQGLELASVVDESSFGEELKKIGYLGQYPADHHLNPLSGHFELHIEQGPRLEQSGAKIGVVTGIQGNRRYGVTIQGEKAHAGSTYMEDRTDALTAAAKIIVRVEDLAKQTRGFATVGVINLADPSINCVPGHVYFNIDIRHPSAELLELSEQSLFAEIRGLEQDKPKLKIDVARLWESPAVEFSKVALECVSVATVSRVGARKSTELISFAGHDSAMTALRVPTAMLFVPSKNGISHAPAEFTSQDQCADGVQVLLDTVLLYDRILQERHGLGPLR